MAGTRDAIHLQRLKGLFAAGRYSPNCLDQQGLCHIHHAALRGYLLCAKWLYKHGSSLTVRSGEGSVPAHYAAAGGHLECLKWIHRKASKSISMTDNNGAAPLYFAAQEGHLNCLEWLGKHSGTGHWEESVDGMTAAHAAALQGHLGCLAFLLGSAGCRALTRDKVANTPLHYAAACGHRPCVDWLLANSNCAGNERNKLGSSPMHLAAQNGHLEVVKLLVRGGAAIKLHDRLGRTPYNVAIESGNEACAQFLYQAEACKNDILRRPFSGNHVLKRVRFERKAIERDFDYTHAQQSSHATPSGGSRERVTRKPYTLHRHGTECLEALNRPSSTVVHSDISSQMDWMYTVQPFETSSKDLHMKRHVKSRRLLPWSRVYRMKTSTENLYQLDNSGSYSSWNTKSADGFYSEPLHSVVASQPYMSTSHENLSLKKRSSSLLSSFLPSRKNQELFPLNVDHFDDIINNNARESNILKRLYRFSREKLTKSSSFAIEHASQYTDSWHKKNSIVVSGHDDFFIFSLNSQEKTSLSQKEERERARNRKDNVNFSSTQTDPTDHSFKSQEERSISSSGESGDRKVTRKSIAISQTPKEIRAPRDSSLIW